MSSTIDLYAGAGIAHLAPDGGLDGDLELRARDELLELLGELAPHEVRLAAMRDAAERVHVLAVQPQLQLDQVRLAEPADDEGAQRLEAIFRIVTL